MTEYTPQNFDHILGLPGFSDQLLKNHFTLYQGYVTNTNKVFKILDDMLKADKGTSPEFAELTRRFGWEFNGMRLHELYFGNMTVEKGKQERDNGSALAAKIKEEYGTLDVWEKDFRQTGAMRGVGWVVLTHDKKQDRLFNTWVEEHNIGHLATCEPILILDCFEHAFMLDYGIKRADYIEAFMKGIDWRTVEGRFQK